MPEREPIALETDPDDPAQPKPQTDGIRSKRAPAIPPLGAREPFWWAVASAIAMVVALVFVLLVSQG